MRGDSRACNRLGMRFRPTLRNLVLALALSAPALPASAHEGHDHGAPPPPVSATIAPRADASSEDFEMVVIARDGRLQIYLDTFRGNETVADAAIEVDGPDGTVKAEPDGAGGYGLPAPWLARPGDYALAITVQAKGLVDVLTASLTIPAPPAPAPAAGARWGEIIGSALAADLRNRLADGGMTIYGALAVAFAAGFGLALLLRRRPRVTVVALALALIAPHDSHAASPAAAPPGSAATTAPRDIAQRFPDGALFVPKPTQRILAIRTLFTEERTYPRSVEMPGRVIPDPNRAGYVQASVAGRLIPPPGGFPRLGARVAAGDVLALVQPAINSADATTQQQQARELDQQISIVARVERLRQIQPVVARAQLEDAELELKGLRPAAPISTARRANRKRSSRPSTASSPAVQRRSPARWPSPTPSSSRSSIPDALWVEALSFEPHALAAEASGRLADGGTLQLAPSREPASPTAIRPCPFISASRAGRGAARRPDAPDRSGRRPPRNAAASRCRAPPSSEAPTGRPWSTNIRTPNASCRAKCGLNHWTVPRS